MACVIIIPVFNVDNVHCKKLPLKESDLSPIPPRDDESIGTFIDKDS